MPASEGPVRSQYKAVVIACRCCCNHRRFVVTEEEAGYVEAQWVDGNDKLLFTTYDLSALDRADGGKFSQSLNAADLSGLQVFPLLDSEVAQIRGQMKKEGPLPQITPKPVAAAQRRAREIGQAAQTKKAGKMPGLPTLLAGVKK